MTEVSGGREYGQFPPKYAGFKVRVSEEKSIPFFVKVQEPGIYFVNFEVDVLEGNGEESNYNGRVVAWSSSQYVIVNKVQ